MDKTSEVVHMANWAIRHGVSTNVLSATKASRLTTDITSVRTQHLYFLKKVHKSPHSIRPIVSCSSGPTENLSGHLYQILSAHLDRVPTLVKNSQQAISILQSLPLASQPDVTSGGSRNSKLGWPDPRLFLNCCCCSLLLLFRS